MLQAGQSSVTLEGGNITFACPGNFSVKGGQHVFESGTNSSAQLPALPDMNSKLQNFIAINYRDVDGEPMAEVNYKIFFAGGSVIRGKLDKYGNARHENVPEKPISAEYEEHVPLPEDPWRSLADMLTQAERRFNS